MPKQKLKWYPVENDREYAYAGLEVTTERSKLPEDVRQHLDIFQGRK